MRIGPLSHLFYWDFHWAREPSDFMLINDLSTRLPAMILGLKQVGIHCFLLNPNQMVATATMFTNWQVILIPYFFSLPKWSVLRLRRVDSDGDVPCSFTISVVQPAPLGSAQGTGYEVVHRRVNLVSRTAGGVGLTGRNDPPSAYEAASADFVFAFAIEWVCDCVEITVAQHHGCDTPTVCSISGRLDFHGLEVRPEKLVFVSWTRLYRLYAQDRLVWKFIAHCFACLLSVPSNPFILYPSIRPISIHPPTH